MSTKRQTEILEKSIILIAEKGIQGFTIRNLAKKVGVTESAIYRHFKSKVSILCTILENFNDILLEFIKNIDQIELSSLDKIEYIYKNHIQEFIKNPALVSVLFAEEIFKNEKELSLKMMNILDINQNNFEKVIACGQKKEEIRNDLDKGQLALIVLASLRLTVKKWELTRYSFSLETEGAKISHTIKTLLRK